MMTATKIRPALNGVDTPTLFATLDAVKAREAGQRVVVATATYGERGTAEPRRWSEARMASLRRHELVQRALGELRAEVIHRIETPHTIVVGFLLLGRHVGPYPSPFGSIAPTGVEVRVRTTDILTVVDGRVADVW